jgi:hypothetical protein
MSVLSELTKICTSLEKELCFVECAMVRTSSNNEYDSAGKLVNQKTISILVEIDEEKASIEIVTGVGKTWKAALKNLKKDMSDNLKSLTDIFKE